MFLVLLIVVVIKHLITNKSTRCKGNVFKVMETKVSVKAVRVYQTSDMIRYRADIDSTVDAIVVRDGEYVEDQVGYLDFHPTVLIAQCINLIPGLDVLYNKKKEASLRSGNEHGFGAAELQVVLRDAKVTIDRTKFEVGEEYESSTGEKLVHEHAGYNTNIVNIEVSDRTQKLLDKVIDSVFCL